MSFKILLVTATLSEAEALKKIKGMEPVREGFRFGNCDISLLISGVGSISTAWALKQWFSMNEKPDLAVNAGIAGSYSDDFVIGDVTMVVSDCFADSGIEDDDEFFTLAEAGLSGADEFPFSGGVILADKNYLSLMRSVLKPAKGITVNTATGSLATRNKLFCKFNPDIETMEGATFFYICAREKMPFLAVRAISNMVEKRNISRWEIPLALDRLSEKLKEVFNRMI